ncbi:MAG: 50S ribosomal protein L27 [Candidatus Nealsonbacteria bacterium]
MSTTKAAGSTKLGRDSQPQYLGVKLYGGEKAKAGDIIVRQRGTSIVSGENTKTGSDDTIYSIKEGIVNFTTKRKINFDGSKRKIKVVSVQTK